MYTKGIIFQLHAQKWRIITCKFRSSSSVGLPYLHGHNEVGLYFMGTTAGIYDSLKQIDYVYKGTTPCTQQTVYISHRYYRYIWKLSTNWPFVDAYGENGAHSKEIIA